MRTPGFYSLLFKKFSVAIIVNFLIIVLILFMPVVVSSHPNSTHESSYKIDKYSITHRLASAVMFTRTITDFSLNREAKVQQTGRWFGAVAGSFMGVAHIYWRATGVSGPRGPMWKNLLTGIPSSIVGAYVGIKTTEWTTKQIMNGNPKPGKAVLKGALYGAIDGTVTFAASLIPLLIIGHYAETIHFNFNKKMIVFKLLGSAVAGGMIYGGTFGAVVGGISGPCISFYMKF